MEFIDGEVLIMEIEKHKCLYDAADIDYKNRIKKQDAWTSVCEVVVGDRWGNMEGLITDNKH